MYEVVNTLVVCLLSSLNCSQCLFNPVCLVFYGFCFVFFAFLLIRVISMDGVFLRAGLNDGLSQKRRTIVRIDIWQIVYLSYKDPCPIISIHKSEIKVGEGGWA